MDMSQHNGGISVTAVGFLLCALLGLLCVFGGLLVYPPIYGMGFAFFGTGIMLAWLHGHINRVSARTRYRC
jgi:hypothetical protein